VDEREAFKQDLRVGALLFLAVVVLVVVLAIIIYHGLNPQPLTIGESDVRALRLHWKA
jgi:hypothetical protein